MCHPRHDLAIQEQLPVSGAIQRFVPGQVSPADNGDNNKQCRKMQHQVRRRRQCQQAMRNSPGAADPKTARRRACTPNRKTTRPARTTGDSEESWPRRGSSSDRPSPKARPTGSPPAKRHQQKPRWRTGPGGVQDRRRQNPRRGRLATRARYRPTVLPWPRQPAAGARPAIKPGEDPARRASRVKSPGPCRPAGASPAGGRHGRN